MRNKILSIVSLLLIPVLFTNVSAKSVLEVDNNVKTTGVSESSRFVLGNNVNSSEEVDGISLILGNDINVKGSASYGVYSGNIIYINTTIENDLFIAGNTVNIGSDAQLGRDVYVIANDLKVNANIERNLRFAGGTLDISGVTINGNLYTAANEITMDEGTTITGKFMYDEEATLIGVDKASIGSKKEYKRQSTTTIWDKIYKVLEGILAALVVMLVLFHFIPSFKAKLDKEKLETNELLKTMVKGAVALLIIPIIAFIALMTGTLTPLALIVFALYLIGLYLSGLITSYILCKKLLAKRLKKESEFVILIIAIVTLKLLSLVPYVGSFINIVYLLYGMGILYKIIKIKK